MVAYRSRRLESLFGAPLPEVTAGHVDGLVRAAVTEAFDLDYKRTLYGRGDSDRRALAGDVAALANTAGGVVVLGVEEDEHACAIATPGVELSDAETARMRQIVASLVSPMPEFDVLPVPTESTPGHGFFLIAVPPSLSAPHAVLVNDALRYPRRNGATTRYLSEPEVATAYRERQAGLRRQEDRATEIEAAGSARLERGDRPWLAVSLVPDIAGDLLISAEAFEDFRKEMTGQPATVVFNGYSFQRVLVGARRLLASNFRDFSSPLARFVSLELHTDGAGFYAVQVSDAGVRQAFAYSLDRAEAQQAKVHLVDDDSIALGIVSGVHHLASHALDRAHAGGNALVHAWLLPAGADWSIQLGADLEVRTADLSGRPPAIAEMVGSLADLAVPGPSLTAAAAILLHQIGHGHGVPELGQLDRDGRIRRRHWSPPWREQVETWARQAGIAITDELLP